MKRIQISGKYSDKFILVSDEDFDYLKNFTWHLVCGYAQAYIKGKTYKAHRIICSAKDGEIVDHIDRNKLNNQRENLRIASKYLNVHNRACGRFDRKRNFLGTEFIKNGYRAVITRFGKRIVSASYKSELAAAIRFNQFLDQYNFDGVKNTIPLSFEDQEKLLISDSLARPKAKFTSGIPGISFNKGLNKWQIRKTINGKRLSLGYTENLERAIIIYNNH